MAWSELGTVAVVNIRLNECASGSMDGPLLWQAFSVTSWTHKSDQEDRQRTAVTVGQSHENEMYQNTYHKSKIEDTCHHIHAMDFLAVNRLKIDVKTNKHNERDNTRVSRNEAHEEKTANR